VHEEISPPELTQVIARLSALFGQRQGDIRPLRGGVSNRNLLVNFGGTDYVVRLPGKDTELLGIDRESERLATRKAADLGMAPKVAAMLDDPPCLVTYFVEGTTMTPEQLRSPGVVAEVAYALRAFHDCELELPATFRPYELVRRYAEAATARSTDLPEPFDAALERAGQIVDAVREHPEHAAKPTHNDLLAANFLRTSDRVAIVDWEYAGLGDPYFDLGSFAANNELSDSDEESLLSAYFREPATSRRTAALKLFRFMSDFREGMWGVVQSAVSTLGFDFSGYARTHFERVARSGGDSRFPGWLEDARPRISR
jgi:thiamine kinase-like enzyme